MALIWQWPDNSLSHNFYDHFPINPYISKRRPHRWCPSNFKTVHFVLAAFCLSSLLLLQILLNDKLISCWPISKNTVEPIFKHFGNKILKNRIVHQRNMNIRSDHNNTTKIHVFWYQYIPSWYLWELDMLFGKRDVTVINAEFQSFAAFEAYKYGLLPGKCRCIMNKLQKFHYMSDFILLLLWMYYMQNISR